MTRPLNPKEADARRETYRYRYQADIACCLTCKHYEQHPAGGGSCTLMSSPFCDVSVSELGKCRRWED